MAVIWGLDLHDMQWSKFKSSYMFGNRDYHLRRTKFVVYQLAMILCVVSESLGTAALSKYVDQQSDIERLHSSARVHNDDFVGIASYSEQGPRLAYESFADIYSDIFVGVSVATIFGAAFFFDLFFPTRYEPTNIRWAWRISAVVVSIMALGDAIAFTVIIAKGTSWISADDADQRAIAREAISPPLRYRDYGEAVASLVLLWLGLVATVARYIQPSTFAGRIIWLTYVSNTAR